MPDSGKALARMIVNHEREDMYYSQTLVDTKAFGAFTTAWGGMISRLKKDSRAWKSHGMKIILYNEVLYWDIERFVSGFQVVYQDQTFQSVVRAMGELIIFHHVNPANDMMKMYCGLSIMAMTTRYDEVLKRYGRLKFFQTFDMRGLYEAFEAGRKKTRTLGIRVSLTMKKQSTTPIAHRAFRSELLWEQLQLACLRSLHS